MTGVTDQESTSHRVSQDLQTRVSKQLSRQQLLIISRASGAGHFQGYKVFSRTFSGLMSLRESQQLLGRLVPLSPCAFQQGQFFLPEFHK